MKQDSQGQAGAEFGQLSEVERELTISVHVGTFFDVVERELMSFFVYPQFEQDLRPTQARLLTLAIARQLNPIASERFFVKPSNNPPNST
jgi:hypothetical protein